VLIFAILAAQTFFAQPREKEETAA
jgi:hypothetical protein